MSPFPLNGMIFYPVARPLWGHPGRDVWGFIRALMGRDGSPASYSWEHIGKVLNLSRGHVGRLIRRLRDEGWIVSEASSGRGHFAQFWAIVPLRERVIDGRAVLIKGSAGATFSEAETGAPARGKGSAGAQKQARRRAPTALKKKNEIDRREAAAPPRAPEGRRLAASTAPTTDATAVDEDGHEDGIEAMAEPPADPVARALYDRIGEKAFRLWFRGAVFGNTDGLSVSVGDTFRRDYIKAHFREALQALAAGKPVRVTVASTAAEPSCVGAKAGG